MIDTYVVSKPQHSDKNAINTMEDLCKGFETKASETQEKSTDQDLSCDSDLNLSSYVHNDTVKTSDPERSKGCDLGVDVASDSDDRNRNNAEGETSRQCDSEVEATGKELTISNITSALNEVDGAGTGAEKKAQETVNICHISDENVKVICPFCDYVFDEFSSEIFAEHLKSVHGIKKSLESLLGFSYKILNLSQGNYGSAVTVVVMSAT